MPTTNDSSRVPTVRRLARSKTGTFRSSWIIERLAIRYRRARAVVMIRVPSRRTRRWPSISATTSSRSASASGKVAVPARIARTWASSNLAVLDQEGRDLVREHVGRAVRDPDGLDVAGLRPPDDHARLEQVVEAGREDGPAARPPRAGGRRARRAGRAGPPRGASRTGPRARRGRCRIPSSMDEVRSGSRSRPS